MARLRFALPLLLLAFAACGGDGDPEESAAPASATGSGSDIVSIAVDPSDGTLFAGSGQAFYRFPKGATTPEQARGALATPKGSGTLTKDVVVRVEKPGTIIASGHSGEAALPAVLGMVRSTDKGDTWESISGLGEADYHEIEIVGDRIYALRLEDPGMIQISEDGGKTWDTREAPSVATPIDVAVNPADPKIWAVSSDQGVFVSKNEGRSWRQRDTTFGPRLAWGAPDALYLAGKDGKVKRSADNGDTWQEVGTIGAGPKELIVSPEGALYASVSGPEIRRSTDGGASWEKVISLGA